MRRWRVWALLSIVFAVGCGSDGSVDTAPPCTGAACATKFDDCPDDAVSILGGGCTKVGVTECATGFTLDNGGCAPTLPAGDCAKGTYALPGEPACHEVAPCGDLPAEATVFVDGSYTAGGSDGSRTKPFTTIAAGISAASAGATIAINDGTYNESPVVGKAVTLVGRCPAKVEIRGSTRTLAIRAAATVRGVAVTGSGQGVAIDGVGVRLQNVWVHDTGGSAIVAFAPGKDIVVEGALIEAVKNTGAYVEGATLTLGKSVIRDVTAGSDGRGGNGVQAQISRDGAPSTVTIGASMIERTSTTAVLSYGSTVAVEGSLLREVRGRADTGGCVLGQKGSASPRTSDISITQSVLAGCGSVGVAIAGGSLLFDRSVVRDVRPEPIDQRLGLGLDGALGATLTVRDSLVEQTLLMGIFIGASKATIERTIVRDIAGQTSNGANGAGIAVVRESDAEPVVTIDRTLVLRTHTAGVFANGGSLTITNTTVRKTETQVSDNKFGDGIEAIASYNTATMEALPSTLTISDSLVRDSARAGVVNLGSTATLARSAVRCAPIELALGSVYAYNGETPLDAPHTLNDGGGMACGCSALAVCKAQTTSLEPISINR